MIADMIADLIADMTADTRAGMMADTPTRGRKIEPAIGRMSIIVLFKIEFPPVL
jgi:hypothetical protein